jgi:hypothetical protein
MSKNDSFDFKRWMRERNKKVRKVQRYAANSCCKASRVKEYQRPGYVACDLEMGCVVKRCLTM